MPELLGPIADDELLLRRIPAAQGWFDPKISTNPDPNAYKPHPKTDATGLSVSRAQSAQRPEFLTAEMLARTGRSDQGYYVAVLRAGDLRSRGVRLVPDPLPDDPGHSLLPDLNTANRNEDATVESMRALAIELTIRVEGRFVPAK